MKRLHEMAKMAWQAGLKRAFDLTMATLGLIVLSPLFTVVALAIRCDSRGPVFFSQTRVGRAFRPFQIIKFRTMVKNAATLGAPLTSGDRDPRITRAGRFLRWTKIDELPQLLNVLKGEMSLVGPRPEVLKYVDLFNKDYQHLLTVRPGVTDPASLAYRNEGALLGASDDPEHEYVAQILPKKIALSQTYVERMSFGLDVRLICQTLVRILR